MNKILEAGLNQLGIDDSIQSAHAVSGGDINEAYYVRTNEREFFVKLNRKVNAEFFKIEQSGLETIRNSNTISVPKVYGVVTDPDENIPILWMNWIEGKKNSQTDQEFGEQLAQMHLTTNSQYGLEGKSFIGNLVQENTMISNWLKYYRDYRLKGQLELGRSRHMIKGKREKKLVELMEQLERWVPKNPKASLLHGDLWGGNWMVGEEGNPYLIDPSILYGDHEFEIAFTKVFGGFSSQFYETYTSTFPLSDSYKDKEPIYQLYYLLAHLNMFGESYGSPVDAILDRYVG